MHNFDSLVVLYLQCVLSIFDTDFGLIKLKQHENPWNVEPIMREVQNEIKSFVYPFERNPWHGKTEWYTQNNVSNYHQKSNLKLFYG